MIKIIRAAPVLPSANVQRSVEFCCNRLGFEQVADYGDYALVQCGGAEIHFWACDDPKIAEASSAYILVTGVAELFENIKDEVGDYIVVPLTDQEWGMREFIVKDFDGNLLKFGEPIAEAA